jgi:hypothetical protein
MGLLRDMFDFRTIFQSKPKQNGVERVNVTDDSEKYSDEPWVSIVGEGVDPDRGLQIQLDWNNAFIRFLKNSGYIGVTDESVVGQWLVHLYKHVAEEIEQKKINQYE